MLVSCPDCQGKVSVNAAACPHCGSPRKKEVDPLEDMISRGVIGRANQSGCPNCGGIHSIKKINFGDRMLDGVLGSIGKSRVCNQCGHKW